VFRAGFVGFQMRYKGSNWGEQQGRSFESGLFGGRGFGTVRSVVRSFVGSLSIRWVFLCVFSKVI